MAQKSPLAREILIMLIWCSMRPIILLSQNSYDIICRFFSYSLEGRIIPRHQVLIENRINFNLRSMLACSDEEFKNKIEDIVERRRRFESNNVDGSLSLVQTTSNSIDSSTLDDFLGENREESFHGWTFRFPPHLNLWRRRKVRTFSYATTIGMDRVLFLW